MTTDAVQLTLAMRREDLASWENWLSRPETAALEELLASGSGAQHSTFLWGSKGSGKSHILQASCDVQAQNARYVPLNEFLAFPPEQVLAGAERAHLIALDDIECVESNPSWQEALFSLFNLCQESGGRLLVTSGKPPQHLEGMLPDLRSRLGSLPVFQMPRFSDEQIVDLLRLRGEAAGLQMGEEVVRYCALRLPRSPSRVVEFINALDKLSLAERRAITIPFVRQSGLLR